MKIKPADITLYLNTKSEFYKSGWRAAEAKKHPKKVPDGDNPFYAEYESGYEDCILNKE
tara:strand:+ start:94 stop:270 length:177 start_codon:yes stop_codon:yes gene_type:complete